MTKVYYAYFDRHTRLFFYLNAEDGSRSWLYPTDGYVYEPVTLRPVYPSGSSLHWEDGDYDNEEEPELEPEPDSPAVISIPFSLPRPVITQSEPILEPSAASSSDSSSPQNPPPSDAPPTSAVYQMITQSMAMKLSHYASGATYRDFVSQIFKPKHIESNLTCPKSPGGEPLLSFVKGRDSVKGAKEISKHLLTYVYLPLDDRSKDSSIGAIYHRLVSDPSLIDEMYCQIMRVIFQPPSASIMLRGLQVMILLTTFFAPSEGFCDPIANFLASLSRQQKILPEIVNVGMIALFRLEALCTTANLAIRFHKRDPREIDQIWVHSTSTRIFYWGISLSEIFLKQQSKYPGLVLPKVIEDLGKALLQLGAERTEGIFKVPGNNSKVEEIIGKAENGQDFITGYSIHDLASAFKNWYRDVPGGIVGRAEMGLLMEIVKAESDGTEFIILANKLAPPNRFALMYLVGFLRRLEGAAEVTKMKGDAFAMVFAPNVVQIDGDPLSVSNQTAAAKTFLVTLITFWNVSAIYDES